MLLVLENVWEILEGNIFVLFIAYWLISSSNHWLKFAQTSNLSELHICSLFIYEWMSELINACMDDMIQSEYICMNN